LKLALATCATVPSWEVDDRPFHEALAARGIPIVPTEWLARGTSPDIESLCRPRGWKRAFIKPCVGATARETLRFDADDPAAGAHARRLLPHEDVMLQPYLSRVERDGELSAIFIDGELTHSVRKVPVTGDYRVQDDFGAKDYAIDFPDVALARRTMEVLSRRLLYGRADFLIDDDGLKLTELELVEPSLFFRHGHHAADRLAEAIADLLLSRH